MSSIINASTSSGLVQTADTSGTLELQSNGTTMQTISSTGSYGQLVRGAAVTAAGQTSINFGSIPSWVKRITIGINALSSSGTSIWLVQLGTAGGIQNTNYSAGYSAGTTAAASSAGFPIAANLAAANTYSGICTIVNIGSDLWVASSIIQSNAVNVGTIQGGSKSLGGTLTQLTLTTTNGTDTFDTTPSAGSINILYEG